MVKAAAETAPRLARLTEQVLSPGLCVACGACVGLCPHILFFDGQIAAPDPCTLDQGRCYDLCPQAAQPGQNEKRAALHAAKGQELQPPLGPVRQAWQARATDPGVAKAAQYGGVVSTLAALVLETGAAGSVVMAQADQRGAPQGVLVSSRPGVLDSAGSIYAAGGGLSALNQALAADGGPLALVGLPCQIMAAASMKEHPAYPQAGERLALTIGLFCTWNLTARGLRALLKQQGVSGEIKKMDIPPPPAEVFRVTTGQGEFDIPLNLLREQTMPGCGLCPDMTAELSDISVGAVEGRPGWNTVLVRTKAGAVLLEEAKSRGLITLEPTVDESMDHLRIAAGNKRARAEKASKERSHG